MSMSKLLYITSNTINIYTRVSKYNVMLTVIWLLHHWMHTQVASFHFHCHLTISLAFERALLMTCVCPCCVPMHEEAGHSYLSLHCQVLQRLTRNLHTCDETAAHEADHSSEQTHILTVIWLLQCWIHALQVADSHRTNTVLLLAFEHELVCVLVVYPCTRKQVTHACFSLHCQVLQTFARSLCMMK